jgi:hypothetical protein
MVYLDKGRHTTSVTKAPCFTQRWGVVTLTNFQQYWTNRRNQLHTNDSDRVTGYGSGTLITRKDCWKLGVWP